MDIATPRQSESQRDVGISQIQLKEIVIDEHAKNAEYEDSWEPDVAQRILRSSSACPSGRPFMVALVGIPGSGKSVSSLLLANKLQELAAHDDEMSSTGNTTNTTSSIHHQRQHHHEVAGEAMIMPHDGYHLPLESLRLFQDPEDAVYRRGAPDTFDPAALLRDLNRIKYGDEDIIRLPAFDHAKGDPEHDRHLFDRNQHGVVICEGLYLLHDADGWEEIGKLFDLTIYLNSDVDVCMERLKVRNRCIPGYTPEEIDVRCEAVDRVNAMTVMKSRRRAHLVVDSLAYTHPETQSVASSYQQYQHEFPDEPTMERALTSLSLKDIEFVDVDTNNQDWALDITSRAARPRADSLWSQSDTDLDEPEPAALHIGSWEPEAVEKILEGIRVSGHSQESSSPYMVALVGMPGSGKSVSAFLVANMLEEHGFETMIMPHDGYHYPLEYLKTFPDANDAIYRRGSPDTFDAHALLRDLTRIKHGDEGLIMLPAFDHSRADPEPDTHAFDRHRHKVILCEGLWLLHDQDGWQDVASMFDYSIFMDSDVDVCVERVKIRNKCIPGYTTEQLERRCEEVDRVNAMTCLRSRARAKLVVDSLAKMASSGVD